MDMKILLIPYVASIYTIELLFLDAVISCSHFTREVAWVLSLGDQFNETLCP